MGFYICICSVSFVDTQNTQIDQQVYNIDYTYLGEILHKSVEPNPALAVAHFQKAAVYT